jgi:predicted dehydrogenase
MGILDLLRRRPEPSGRRFGYAVVGLGHIADYFMDALRDSPSVSVTALVSGNAAKAEKLARQYSVDADALYSYADFDRLRENATVDAVYLALPVNMHREYTERAAAAGKHVLCEKPMAPNSADARAMIAACAAASVRLSIAYRCPHASLHQRLRQLVRSGVLGSDLRIESGFGFELDPGWRDDPVLAGGGSLFDVGIYPLNASRFLLGEEPILGEDPIVVESATAVCDASGLERSIAWTSVFPSGARADCRSSYTEKIPDSLRITGDLGSLLLEPAFSHRDRYRLRGEYRDPATDAMVRVDEQTPRNEPSEFRLEAEQLADAVQNGVDLLTPGEDGSEDMIAMEAIYAAAGV